MKSHTKHSDILPMQNVLYLSCFFYIYLKIERYLKNFFFSNVHCKEKQIL